MVALTVLSEAIGESLVKSSQPSNPRAGIALLRLLFEASRGNPVRFAFDFREDALPDLRRAGLNGFDSRIIARACMMVRDPGHRSMQIFSSAFIGGPNDEVPCAAALPSTKPLSGLGGIALQLAEEADLSQQGGIVLAAPPAMPLPDASGRVLSRANDLLQAGSQKLATSLNSGAPQAWLLRPAFGCLLLQRVAAEDKGLSWQVEGLFPMVASGKAAAA